MSGEILTWEDVYARMSAESLFSRRRVYGIPRGGSVVAGITHHAVDTPEEADILVDDIIDSGATRDAWRERFPDKPFIALVDKQGKDHDLGWVVFPWEGGMEQSGRDVIIRHLQLIGEDVEREGLRETPDRVVRSWETLYNGYGRDPADVMKVFEEGACDEMVVLRGIDFYSMCEHHMLPFFGSVRIGYLPSGKVIGVSKLARLVEIFARRLQVQERMTAQIADALDQHLNPHGVIVVVEAVHLCMAARGVEKQNSVMITSALRGAFREAEPRAEFMALTAER